MATKWKYATVPAEMRLEMLKNGNDELYAEEISRTKDAISSRLAAGLDVDAQMKWADEVSYNHNLSKAKGMGIEAENVSKDGYAERLFGDMTESTGTENISSPSAPAKLSDTRYYEKNGTKNKSRDELAQSVLDSYVSGINKRAAKLNGSYSRYASQLEAEYDRQIKKLISDYQKSEALYKEAALNGGYSERGGKTMTDRLKAREQLSARIAELQSEKKALLGAAWESLEKQLYSMSDEAMKSVADEYYRYNSLLSDEEQAEYQKQRDEAADSKWQKNFDFEKEQAALSAAERAQEREDNLRDKQLSAELAREQLELKRAENAAEYEKWLKEFESDSKYRDTRLNAELAAEASKLALDREKFEYSKSAGTETPDGDEAKDSGKYGDDFMSYLSMAKKAAAMVTYSGDNGSYSKSYTDAELLAWIKRFMLSEEEKKTICNEIGIKYVK